MCTIIGGKFTYNVESFKNHQYSFDDYIPEVIDILISQALIKGGDYIQFVIFEKKEADTTYETKIVFTMKNIEDIELLLKEIYNYFDSYRDEERINFSFMIFSRLTPEMEINDKDILLQPYKTIDNNFIMAHGTIPIKDFDDRIIDTEILRFQLNINDSINMVENLNGKAAIIKYLPNINTFECIHNGLGLYEYSDEICLKYFSNINLQEDDPKNIFKLKDIDPYQLKVLNYSNTFEDIAIKEDKRNNAVALFSGGLDILTSTHYHIFKNGIEKLDLLYFDWGTNASKQEIKSGMEYRDYLNKNSNIKVDFKILNVKEMFKNILNVCNLITTRLIDSDAKGEGHYEAEEAISYVPVRNSMLINLAVAWAEQQYPNAKIDFIIGANLSEGMIYADNSTSFIDYKNKEIKYIGQKTSQYNLVAPFANVTKTKMLEIATKFLKENNYIDIPFKLSYSCYFPLEDGKSCNKCGSCLLRNNAFKRAGLINHKKEDNTNECINLRGQKNESN